MGTITSTSFSADYIGNEDNRYYSDSARQSWKPANVWSWLWPGKTSQHVTVSGGMIQTGDDVSGNSRNWAKYADVSGLRYTSSLNFEDQDWATDLPVLQGLELATSATIELLSPLNATGEFYLGHAVFNSRGLGNRYMFGGDTIDNTVRLLQENNALEINVAGGGLTTIALNGFAQGPEFWLPFFLEIWRDASNVVHVAINMEEVGTNPEISGTFQISQFGGGPWGGSAKWDDFVLEFWVATAVPTARERTDAYNYLRVKWGF